MGRVHIGLLTLVVGICDSRVDPHEHYHMSPHHVHALIYYLPPLSACCRPAIHPRELVLATDWVTTATCGSSYSYKQCHLYQLHCHGLVALLPFVLKRSRPLSGHTRMRSLLHSLLGDYVRVSGLGIVASPTNSGHWAGTTPLLWLTQLLSGHIYSRSSLQVGSLARCLPMPADMFMSAPLGWYRRVTPLGNGG